MKAKLKHILCHIEGIEDNQLDDILSLFTIKNVKRNTILVSEGEISKSIYLIKSGSMRTYHLTRQGLEKTRYIGFEDSVITSFASFITQSPSKEYVDTLEESELYVLSHKNFYQLVKTIPAWSQFYSKLLEATYIFQNQKIADLITLTAKERYDKLYLENPHYIKRLSNKILASYLDIRQETLSRLKSK